MTLTEEGLEFINKNKGTLSKIAEFKLLEVKNNQKVYGDDAWFLYNKNFCLANQTDVRDEMVDINIWLDMDEGDFPVWKATAYPMEINSVGEVQTNTSEYISLW